MTIPKDLPKEMRGLWMHQYAPREKKMLNILDQKTKNKYKRLKYFQKIAVIDKLEAKGVFG